MCACFMCSCVVMLVLPPMGGNKIDLTLFFVLLSLLVQNISDKTAYISKFLADVAQNISEQFVVGNNRDT